MLVDMAGEAGTTALGLDDPNHPEECRAACVANLPNTVSNDLNPLMGWHLWLLPAALHFHWWRSTLTLLLAPAIKIRLLSFFLREVISLYVTLNPPHWRLRKGWLLLFLWPALLSVAASKTEGLNALNDWIQVEKAAQTCIIFRTSLCRSHFCYYRIFFFHQITFSSSLVLLMEL